MALPIAKPIATPDLNCQAQAAVKVMRRLTHEDYAIAHQVVGLMTYDALRASGSEGVANAPLCRVIAARHTWWLSLNL